MKSSENHRLNKQEVGNHVPEGVDICQDEISLMDYLGVLCKRKRFILLGSIIPTLLVGLIIFFLPRHYTITYIYDVEDQVKNQSARPTAVDVVNWNLTQKNYDFLLSRFCSKGNLNRIATTLEQASLGQYAELIRGPKGLEGLVTFKASPPYVDMKEVGQENLAKREQVRKLEAELLNVTITGTSPDDISIISSAIRDSLENITPVCLIADRLSVGVRELRTKIADIESEKYGLQLILKKNKAVLGKLKKAKTKPDDNASSGIVLQFDVGGKSESLPIEYQIQIAESKVIQLEETAADNKNRHKYYEDLLSLNEKLLAQVKSQSSAAYTIQQFQSFLVELAKDVEQQELKDYLNSYVKGVENRIAVSVPIIKDPRVYAVAKGTVKKTLMVFVVLLMLTAFVAFLLEGLEKSQARAS